MSGMVHPPHPSLIPQNYRLSIETNDSDLDSDDLSESTVSRATREMSKVQLETLAHRYQTMANKIWSRANQRPERDGGSNASRRSEHYKDLDMFDRQDDTDDNGRDTPPPPDLLAIKGRGQILVTGEV
ncbi:hypothetical protein GGX14DRAFT_572152 [Mycena pura]|uniref:Uncharacterized protein n=1 Tax=Mycena pura TaxID=153505 RepID=A0AAD6V5M8_9AGAR|nr:hypothetical protein GGX14DRAFT_572152 [Mycena pura]